MWRRGRRRYGVFHICYFYAPVSVYTVRLWRQIAAATKKREAVALKRIYLRIRDALWRQIAAAAKKREAVALNGFDFVYATNVAAWTPPLRQRHNRVLLTGLCFYTHRSVAADCRRYEKTRGRCLKTGLTPYPRRISLPSAFHSLPLLKTTVFHKIKSRVFPQRPLIFRALSAIMKELSTTSTTKSLHRRFWINGHRKGDTGLENDAGAAA